LSACGIVRRMAGGKQQNMPGETAHLQVSRADTATRSRSRHLRRVSLVLGSVLIVFLAWEVLTSVVAYTDDAFVRSDLVAVSAEVTGHISDVYVHDNQTVRRGDKLLSIDPVPFRLALAASSASVAEARAKQAADRDAVKAAGDQLAAASAALDLAQETQRRAAALTADSFESRQQLDAANAALRTAEANVAGGKASLNRAQALLEQDDAGIARAEAELAMAQWRLSRTDVVAPVDGYINYFTLRVGDTARAEQPVVGIVDADAWRIVANYKQDYLRRFRVGGTAWVWLDAAPWHFYRARIQGIARGISRTENAPTLLPYVAPTTDWIRLQHRFPVTLFLDDPPPNLPLYMGADARTIIFP
jgi:membrane fusion protein, multidrug efflux system